ncbi:MAG TPA: hypothetical protein DIS66_01485, partial [Candidatus Omnitrophica bacterium]|nr:hypothetical protein [Candidatus Omnitrophota bacterium]
EDIFTLFITTRILNFLKGLKVNGEAAIEEALTAAKKEQGRNGLGAEILERLLAGEGLFAATAEGLKPVTKFKPGLFFKVWNQLEQVATQSGQLIQIPITQEAASKLTAS